MLGKHLGKRFGVRESDLGGEQVGEIEKMRIGSRQTNI